MSKPSTSSGKPEGRRKDLALEPLALSLQLGARAYRALWGGIVGGTIESGVQLRPDIIAEQLDISTTPVREALHRLETDGLIVKLPYKGWYVREFTEQEVRDLYESARRWSVSACAWPASDLGRTARLARELSRSAKRRCATRHEATHLQPDLHAAIVEAARNAYLSSLMSQVTPTRCDGETIRLAGRPSRAIEEHVNSSSSSPARRESGAAADGLNISARARTRPAGDFQRAPGPSRAEKA